MVMAPARTLARRRMGACETTPPTVRPRDNARPFTQTPQGLPGLPDDRLPLAGVKLVRPRRPAAPGAPAVPLQREQRGAVSTPEKGTKNSQPSLAASAQPPGHFCTPA